MNAILSGLAPPGRSHAGGQWPLSETSTVNVIVRKDLAATFFREYLALRDQFVEILSDDDLWLLATGGHARRPGPMRHGRWMSAARRRPVHHGTFTPWRRANLADALP